MTPSITVSLAPSSKSFSAAPPSKFASSRTSANAGKSEAKSDKPLYASQSTIPHLPVPTLSSTFHKYLSTIQPLLSKQQFQQSSKLVDDFLASDFSKTLQGRLEQRAKERDSWLSEWWNETAYMGYRGRIVPNVNYFYVHKRGLGKGKSQEERAAELVRGVVEFKKLVDSELLEPEKTKAGPLCMDSYKNLFNASRIPTSPADVPLAYPSADHIIVVCKDRYFKVDTRGRGKQDLIEAFKEVKRVAYAKGVGAGVGILTADDRDVWTDARRHLLSLSEKNTNSLQAIESSILLVCLDDDPPPANEDERAWRYWSGGSGRVERGQGYNRWFDKHEVIVDVDGETGFNGEHSMLDGTPTLRLNEFILASLDAGKIPLELPENEKSKTPMPKIEELEFELDGKMREVIKKSKDGFGKEMVLQDLKMVHFTGYGKNLIKTHKVSPDAWAQAVKHLAFYRLFSRPGVTYESCQTRKFLLGRTEVIRSLSNEMLAFVKSVDDPKSSDSERAELLRKAVGRHVQYSVWAADAQGVDRHMFGLRKLVREKDGETMPGVFTDEAFGKSGHWEMSTSQLSSKWLDGWGYGEVVDDGYGLSYAIGDDDLRWCVTTKNEHPNAGEFAEALKKASKDLGEVMARAQQAEGDGKAKH